MALRPDGLLMASEMFELGLAMREQTLRRQFPAESDAEIGRRVQAWLFERPGAPDGDCVGIRRTASSTPTR